MPMKRKLLFSIFLLVVVCSSVFAFGIAQDAPKLTIWDILMKFHFDLGSEPEKAGNITYGMIQYDWTDFFATRFDLRYTTRTEDIDEVEGYGNPMGTTKYRIFETDLLPFVGCFGRDDDGRLFTASVGFSYQYSKESEVVGMFDINNLMLDEGDGGKYFTMTDNKKAHFFALRLGFTAKIPFYADWELLNGFCFNFEGFVNPFYYMILDQSMAYQSDQTLTEFNYSGQNKVARISSPFVDVKISLDMFDFLRFMTRLNYQRLNFQQMDWNENSDGLEGKDDVQQILTLRVGFETLSISERSTKVRAGIYWQQSWNTSSYFETSTASGKFVFSIGSEM